MTNTKKSCWWVLAFLFLAVHAVAKTCVWTAQSGNWADSANWADGILPEAGDDVALVGSGGAGGNILLEGATTVALSAISNTAATLQFRAQLASSDATTFVKRGGGTLNLYATNTALNCSFVLEDGRLQILDDLSLGAVPETLRADAITLRGGALFTHEFKTSEIILAPTRGVTVDGLGYFSPRSKNRDGIGRRLHSPAIRLRALRRRQHLHGRDRARKRVASVQVGQYG